MKRRTFFVAALAVLGLAVAGCSTAPPAAPSASASPVATPTIGLTYIPNIQFSPFYVAESAGLFTEAGVAPTLRHHGASEGLFTALAAGQEDFVVAGGDEMLQARAEGLDLISIATYYRGYPVVIIVPEGSDITTAADLKGHSVGIPGRYGESWFGLQVAMKAAGLTEEDVAIEEIGYTQQAALTTGKVDAIVGFANNDAVQFGLAGVPVRSIPLADSVPLVGISLVTTGAYAEAHPEATKAVADAMVAGVARVVGDPEGAVEASVAYVPGLSAEDAKTAARATLDATIKVWTAADGTVSGKQDAEAWAAMAAFMAEQGLTASAQDAAAAMTNDYVSA